MEHQPLHSINFQGSVNNSAAAFSPNSLQSLSDGSWNAIVSGDGYVRAFKGMDAMVVNSGSRKMMIVGKQFGGIKDNGLVQGSGSFFEDIGRSRWGIGSGIPHIEGVNVPGWTLSTNLQVQVASGGIYGAPFQAGLLQPSAPEIGILQIAGDVSNSVSCKIERRRPSTGARSLASPTSAVIQPTNNRVRVTFPLASNGQTHWRTYFTFQGFGGTGIHYLVKYGSETDIPESVVAAGLAGGIARSLEFNYKDGDLVPLEASYDDYSPPAATHAIRLENVLNLAGCYSDTSFPTSTNPGTAIAVSKINNYESYVPTHLLFLPEQVVDTLARPISDFGYVACENSIHAIQYVGFRGDELPPCTLTTVLPDIGIQYPHNWTHFRGQLLIFTAEGNLLLMGENGTFDTTFAAPIVKTLQKFTPENTIVGYDPQNDLIMVANGKHILVYSLARGVWRQIWLPDYGIAGVVTACTTAKRKLYISITDGASVRSYSFDTANQAGPMSFVSTYQNAPTGNALVKDIFEIAVSAETGADTSLVLCINTDLEKTVFRRISTVEGSSIITDADSAFEARMFRKSFALFAPNIGGTGIDFILGRLVFNMTVSTATLVDLNDNPIAPQVTVDDALMFVGEYVDTAPIKSKGLHFSNIFPNIPEVRSYQVAAWMKGAGDSGNILSAEIFGTFYSSSRAHSEYNPIIYMIDDDGAYITDSEGAWITLNF